MKSLLFIFLPLFVWSQPKKATIYSKKSGQTLNNNLVVWKDEQAVVQKFFMGVQTITIDNEQYSIDSAQALTEGGRPIYAYFLSLRGRKARCFLYPSNIEKEWELLVDDNTLLTLFRLRE